MSIGKRIRELRESKGLTQNQLAKLLGITKSAVGNYELDLSGPKESVLYKLIDVLECDANYLFQDGANISNSEFNITPKEKDHIKKYRTLSENDKKAVDNLIDTLCNKFPFGYDERLKCFTDVDGARAYLKEHNELSPALSDKALTDDDICEMATRRYNK